MLITEILERAREPLYSYEIIPPRRGGSLDDILRIVDDLAAFRPPFIDVTSHSAQESFEQKEDGTWRRTAKRKRPGTLGLCAAIKSRYGIETVPHLLCLGFTREETEDALIELQYLGIDNLMALRGDDHGHVNPMPPDRTRNEYAVDLVHQVAAMNRGKYLEPLADTKGTNFCVGVAGYPEKHFEAPNLSWDLERLKAKVDAGAHYITTQMFFDNAHYFRFQEACTALGISIPIIPGLKIITSKRQLQVLPRVFHLDLPDDLCAEIMAADDKHVPEIGAQWTIKQTEELVNAGVPCVHYYIMQSTRHVRTVVSHMQKM